VSPPVAIDESTVLIKLRSAASRSQVRRELDVYLATWQATNTGVETYVVDRDRIA
jgi:hypothetical protein